MAALRVADPFAVEELRVRTFDGFQVIKPRVKTARPVTIIDIDEKSMAKLGQWPWPRTRVADLIDKLTALGAVVIAFDIVFAEPDRLNPNAAADTFRNLDEETRTKLRALPSNDQILADALKSSRVVLGQSGFPYVLSCIRQVAAGDGAGDARRGAAAVPVRFCGPAAQCPGAGSGCRGARPVHNQERARRHCATGADDHDSAGRDHAVPQLRNAAGRLRLQHDPDQRRTRRACRASASRVSKFRPIATARSGGISPAAIRRSTSRRWTCSKIASRRRKLRRSWCWSARSAVGLLDVKTTPVDPVMPGVEIHAQVLESVLTQSVLSQPNYAIAAEFFFALVLGLLVIAFAPMFGPVTLVAVGALFATVLVDTSWYFYTQHRLLIDFTYPLVSTTAIYLTLLFANFVREQKQRRAYSLGVRPVSVARADRAAGAVPGETPARRRSGNGLPVELLAFVESPMRLC